MLERRYNMIFETFSDRETYELGMKVGQAAKPGDIVCLSGDLGVGKTVFTKGVAAGLGITDNICSPTFTIVLEYKEGRIPLYHFDVYRIEDLYEMDDIGYEEYFFGDGLCMVEWGRMVSELLPDNTTYIDIEKNPEKGFDYRKITISENDGALRI